MPEKSLVITPILSVVLIEVNTNPACLLNPFPSHTRLRVDELAEERGGAERHSSPPSDPRTSPRLIRL